MSKATPTKMGTTQMNTAIITSTGKQKYPVHLEINQAKLRFELHHYQSRTTEFSPSCTSEAQINGDFKFKNPASTLKPSL